MAKFQQPYVLCPLIGQKSLLGVANDFESDCVIATLGKNMIIRYKLQNQKQMDSWGTKDKLTSPVMYDRVGQRYVGIFAHSQLRLWPAGQEHLDTVKKRKFPVAIHSVLEGLDDTGPVVVFQNGAACPLDVALAARKTVASTALLRAGETIRDCRLVEHEGIKQVAILANTPKGGPWCVMVPVSGDWVSHRFEVVRGDAPPGVHLVGHAFASDDQQCRIFTMWSDGELSVQPAVAGAARETLAVVTAVSTANPVSMLPLSPSQLALYGADPSEEGAVLVVYNVRFGLVQCQLHLKLYSSPPALWRCGEHLLVALGSSLAVVPYRLEAERLASVLGSHRPAAAPPTPDVEVVTELREVSWGSASPATVSTSSSLPPCLRQLDATGCPQALMLETVLPELLEAGQVDEVRRCLESVDDVSERSLVDVLQFCLRRGDGPGDDLLHTVLGSSFSPDAMAAEVRRLPLEQALDLLRRLVEEEREPADEEVVLRWVTLLLDAHYQRYLLARDPQVLDVLTRARDFVQQQLAYVSDMKILLPLVNAVRSGTLVCQNQPLSHLYSIEPLKLC